VPTQKDSWIVPAAEAAKSFGHRESAFCGPWRGVDAVVRHEVQTGSNPFSV
jgi:hypothetical protein